MLGPSLRMKKKREYPLGFQGLCITAYKISEYDQEIPNHKLQTNQWHHEEEPHSNHETQGRQT